MKKAKASLLISLALLLSAVELLAAGTPRSLRAIDAIDSLVAEARSALGAPGLSVALVVDDQLVWSKGYGLADVENEVPARGDTVYRIASVSKPMSATAVLQLVERGRVRLDDPIWNYVPAFPERPVIISLRHLLTHTSGIRHYKPGEFEVQTHFDSLVDAIAIFKDDPLLFTPGSQYSYSSYAYNLLAGVIESGSGLRFGAYMKENVWGPAGMTATRLEQVGEIVPHRARQYVKAGGNGAVRNAPYADLSVKWAGGGIVSSVEDLARFHIALNQGKLLKPETLSQMYTPFTLSGGKKTNYGFGWQVNVDERERTWIAHSGGATGGSSYLLRYPEGRLAVAIIANVQDAGNLRELAMRIAESALEP